MTWITRSMLVAGLMLGSTAYAQTTGTTTGTTTTTGNNSGFAGGTNNTQGGNSGFGGQLGQQTIPAPANAVTSGANVNSSNFLSTSYANPYFQGRAGSTGTESPGGFGTALSGGSTGSSFGNRGTNTGSNVATNRNSTSMTGTGATGSGATGTSRTTAGSGSTLTGTGAGGFGGTGATNTGRTGAGSTGFGGANTGRTGGTNAFGGMNSMGGGGQQAGMVAQQARQVNYTLNVRIPQTRIAPAQAHAELTTALTRSSALTSAAGIQVNYDGKVVVLRGAVKDAEEARTAEGIMRLTPGVRAVKNELTFPATPNQ